MVVKNFSSKYIFKLQIKNTYYKNPEPSPPKHRLSLKTWPSGVLAKVFYFAVNGDTGAAKLYFNFMGCLNGQAQAGTFIQNQNNFIQINGTVISLETVKQLNPEQLNSIEAVLKAALPEMKSNAQNE